MVTGVMRTAAAVGQVAAAGAGVIGVAHLVNKGVIARFDDAEKMVTGKQVTDKAASKRANDAAYRTDLAAASDADSKAAIKRENYKAEITKAEKSWRGVAYSAINTVRPKDEVGYLTAGLLAAVGLVGHQAIGHFAGRGACLVNLVQKGVAYLPFNR